MGTNSSDFRFIATKLNRVANSSLAPENPCQCTDAERDQIDGGGAGFMLFLLVVGLVVVAWWLV